MVEIEEEITEKQTLQLNKDLHRWGLELLEEPEIILVEKIRNVVIEMVYYCDEFPRQDPAEYLTDKLKLEYNYMEKVFSEVKGITIGNFIANHKIERIKELILFEDISLAKIADQLCYDSVYDLSNQFEQYTGLSPQYFMVIKHKRKQVSINEK